MIQYRISYQELTEKIEAEKPGWMERAKTKTVDDSAVWSEVKVVYMRIQGGSKCAYCERKMESESVGLGEQAVDHFRPKGRIQAWEAPQDLIDEGISFTAPPQDNKGYPALRYHVFNYAAACNPCNTILKKDYFPIAGTYQIEGDAPETLHQKELPYLIYPVGDFDDNPEDLIQFRGLLPSAVHMEGRKRHRALVTIEIFQLDSREERANLFRDRALIMTNLFSQQEKETNAHTDEERQIAKENVEALTSPQSQHTNCARSFRDLYRLDRDKAKAFSDAAWDYIKSKS